MENQQPEKPRAVALAVYLLWGSLAVGLAKIPLDFPSLAAIPSPAIVWSAIAIVLALYGFLFLKIASGRNWARITFLVFFLLGLILAWPTLSSEFARAPAVGVLSIAQGIMQGYAIFLLFTSPGKTWFQKEKARLPEQGSIS
jgi:hypothetical protein